LAFSPNGNWLAVCTGADSANIEHKDSVDVLNTADLLQGDDTHPVEKLEVDGLCNAVSFSADSNWLAVGTTTREIAIWRIQDNWSPVRGVPYEFYRGDIGKKELETNKVVPANPLPFPGAQINTLAFSPDSRVLAYGTTDSKILLWDIQDRQPPKTIKVHTGGILSIAFSPNGNCLASASTDQTLRITPTAEPRIRAAEKEWISYGSFWSSCVGSPNR
jgi:WD40 repeat protein